MKNKHIQLLGISLAIIYTVFILWFYTTEPKTFAEVATKATVTVGTYEVDKAKFDEGLRAFKQDNFIVARDNFQRADPENKDARTQFYIAYSFYRQGWGRTYSDDALFKQGLDVVNKVIQIDPNFKSDDDSLKMRSPAELKYELEQGLVITPEDFNPLKLLRERK
jgi:hypothetical protein